MRIARLNKEIELFIAGVGAAQSFLLACYAFLERKRDFKNYLLALFLLSIGIRIVKSMLWVYLDATPLWFLNLGFFAHSVSGPALFLYSLYFLFPKKWNPFNFLHFLPSLLLLIFIEAVTLDNFWYAGGYSFLLTHQIIYSVMALMFLGVRFFRKRQRGMDRTATLWIGILIIGTALLQYLYFSNYILGLTPYLLGPVIYLPLIYFLAFLAFKNPYLLKNDGRKKGQNIRLTTEELQYGAGRLKSLMQNQKMYLDTDCTLSKVAKRLQLPAYLVSHIVNNNLGKSFPAFLNEYRVDTAKELLLHPDYKQVNIATIAYDCGFNSLSSFNSAFKKFTGTTPSKFQKGQYRS